MWLSRETLTEFYPEFGAEMLNALRISELELFGGGHGSFRSRRREGISIGPPEAELAASRTSRVTRRSSLFQRDTSPAGSTRAEPSRVPHLENDS